MDLGRIAVVGSEGLLGEIVTSELAQRAAVVTYPTLDGLLDGTSSWGDAIVVWASAWKLGEIRQRLRDVAPAGIDPVLMALDHHDPYIYLCRLQSQHMERYRLGFAEMFEALAECIGREAALTAPEAPQNQLA